MKFTEITDSYVVGLWLPLSREWGEAGFQEGLEFLIHWLVHVEIGGILLMAPIGSATNIQIAHHLLYLFSAAVCLQQRGERVDPLSCNNNIIVNL